MLTRRTALAGLAALALPPLARAETTAQPGLTRQAADVTGKRAAVILLHGSGGIERKPRAYARYGDALTMAGIDAYFLRYMSEPDLAALNPRTSTKASREAYDATRFAGWAETVSGAITDILRRDDSSGRIGLLGFSLGGFIAADTAARDTRVTALAVLYGGMPDAMIDEVRHMPPMIALHGDADTNVSIDNGRKLIEIAKSVGAKAEFVPYAGRPHGFDFSDTDPTAADAIGRVTRFFQARLKPA